MILEVYKKSKNPSDFPLRFRWAHALYDGKFGRVGQNFSRSNDFSAKTHLILRSHTLFDVKCDPILPDDLTDLNGQQHYQ